MNKKFSIALVIVVILLAFTSCASLHHQHGAFYYKVTKEATCAETGLREVYCGECGELVGTEVIPSTDIHHFGSAASLKAPTCTEGGIVSHTCSLCGRTIEEASNPNGHSYSDVTVEWGSWGEEDKFYKVCVVCGDKVQISRTEAETRMEKLGKKL